MKNWLENFIAHRPLLFRIIGRLVRPEEIEDIVQETFLHSYAASRRQEIGNPRAFMVKTARNLALNHLGRAERRLSDPFDEAAALEMADSTADTEQRHLSEEMFMIFCRGVAELPTTCRKVFILKKVYGLSQKEIAEYLDISPSTVEKHVAKGMAMTAEYMDRKGYSVKAGGRAGKQSRYRSVG